MLRTIGPPRNRSVWIVALLLLSTISVANTFAWSSGHPAISTDSKLSRFLAPQCCSRVRPCLSFLKLKGSDKLHDSEARTVLAPEDCRDGNGQSSVHMTGMEEFDRAWSAAWLRKEKIRCPFWRRRAVDFLEASMSVGRFLASRHKSLDPFPPAITGTKQLHLSVDEVMEIIRCDFVERRYYVTGRLSKEVYADDCFFDAPDPDMPVTGLSKYVDAISNLFVKSASEIDLLGLQSVGANLIVARWRLKGTLMLPWRPAVKAYTGTTLYQLDDQGLVISHTELWSISALDAFVSTVFPNWPGAAAEAPATALLLTRPPSARSPDPGPLFRNLKRRRPRSAPLLWPP